MRNTAAFLLASLLPLVAIAGCTAAEAAPSDERAAESLSTRIYLVPVDERARLACRAQDNRYYCSTASADAARAACAQLVTGGDATADDACATGGDRCVRAVTSDTPCTADGETYPDAASCADPIPNNCSYYSACLEPELACGESGYALGYGERYCDAFANDTGFSAAGAAWRDNTMICLQRHLASESPASVAAMSCTTLTDDAFDSHPACYTQPGSSICDLPPSDVLVVLHTISVSDLFSERALVQEAAVARTCVVDLVGRLFGFGLPAVHAPLTEEELRARIELWSGIGRDVDARLAR